MQNEKSIYTYNNSRIRFKTNKPFLLKKISVTVVVLSILIYFFITLSWITSVVLFLFIGIPFVIKIRKQPSEGKGFFGKLASFYKGLFRQYIIDFLPLCITVSDVAIEAKIEKAEISFGKALVETYTIEKDEIIGILYDDMAADILIMFQSANILVCSPNKKCRTVKQQNATLCFNVKENKDILLKLKDCGYDRETLSDLHDEEEETEDPELANTNVEQDVH